MILRFHGMRKGAEELPGRAASTDATPGRGTARGCLLGTPLSGPTLLLSRAVTLAAVGTFASADSFPRK